MQFRALPISLAAVFAAAGAATPVAASTCAVPSTHATITLALADSACSTIQVAAGTYYENIVIPRSLTLEGAGQGATIIDGGANGRVIDVGPGLTVQIKDLTVTNGRLQWDNGAGIRNGSVGSPSPSQGSHLTLTRVTVVGAPEGTDAAWQRAEALATGIEFARELVTEPANIIYPVSFVERCQARFEGTGAELIVLDDAQMAELGMGALLGVGLGSERESRILAIRWNGNPNGGAPTAFVGKGVTFDTGGISLKPGAGMEDMKWDMGGSAAVVGAMLSLVLRKAKVNVVGVVGLVENMPDGKAQRPGDVVTSMNGQTIEVINTDAEGRLVLCDALHWTQQEFQPARIVDFATLTGAMIIALGHEHGGLFANDDQLAEQLLAAGRTSGDKLWRLPLGPAYDKLIDSPIADIKNVGPRQAGSITAAQFLQRFIADGLPWAHCDIAGMVWADKPGATFDKGATGYGVRLIDQFVKDTIEG